MALKKEASTKTKASPKSPRSFSARILRLRQSPRLLILWRCAIHHFIPVAACITLLYLNLKTLYLGNELPGTRRISDAVKLQALQLAAKLHELFMIASLSMIALDTVTYRLVASRRGLPLGLIDAGFFFNSLDFLM